MFNDDHLGFLFVVLTKVDEFQTYRYNSIGLRGPEPPAEPDRYTKIFTVGGSTTACVELTDGKTWPDQLLMRLEQAGDMGSGWESVRGRCLQVHGQER